MKAIKAELLARADKRGMQSSVVAGTTLLTAGEVSAFLDRAGDLPTALQSAVAARVLLIGALEMQKRTGQSPGLKTLVEMAEREQAKIQEQLEKNPADKDVLASTRRQLQLIIQHALKLSG